VSDFYEPIELDWKSLDAKDAFATVTKVELGQSKKLDETFNPPRGARYLKISFSLDGGGSAEDLAMIDGKWAHLGMPKLTGLGAKRGQPLIPADIQGRRVYVRLKPDEGGRLQVKKYLPFPEDAPPPPEPPPPAAERTADTPF
jgi:hypothetical protein